LNAVGLLQRLDEGVRRACEEGIESARNTPNLGLHIGGSLASNLQNLITGGSSREGISFDSDINCCVVIVVNDLIFFRLGQLDLGASLFLERFDCRATFADDVCASGMGNGDLDGRLLI
jgi:hypothetical protein